MLERLFGEVPWQWLIIKDAGVCLHARYEGGKFLGWIRGRKNKDKPTL